MGRLRGSERRIQVRGVTKKNPPSLQLVRISHRLTVEARDRSAITSLRLLAVIDSGAGVARYAPTSAGRTTWQAGMNPFSESAS